MSIELTDTTHSFICAVVSIVNEATGIGLIINIDFYDFILINVNLATDHRSTAHPRANITDVTIRAYVTFSSIAV